MAITNEEHDKINLSTLRWFRVAFTHGNSRYHIVADLPKEKMARAEVLGALDRAEIADYQLNVKGAATSRIGDSFSKEIERAADAVLVNEAGAEKLAAMGVSGPVFDAIRGRETAVSPARIR